jgi:nitrogen fixation protein FixH
MSGRPLQQAARKSRWIPWLFVGGFLVVVAANGALVAFALGTFTGLTTSEPYTKGLRHNDTLRLLEAQQRLGWRIATRIERPAPGRLVISLAAADADGSPLRAVSVSAEFVRPLERGRDFTTAFDDLGRGRHRLELALPLPGQWEVRYRIRRDGDLVELRERVQIEDEP